MTSFAKDRIQILLAVGLLLALLLPSVSLAADDDKPTVAFLLFGRHPVFDLFGSALLDMFEAYEYIDADERATLENGQDLRGDKINILNREAGFDFATATLMVEDALDEGADVILTVSNEVGYIAANSMRDMEAPPAMIFAIVTAPEVAGIVQSDCVKPPNVTGTRMNYDEALYEELLFIQDPDIDAYGILLDSNDPAHSWWISESEKYAEKFGLRLEVATGATDADWQLATQSLLDKEVDAIVIMPHTADPARGVAAVISEAYGAPVYSVNVTDVLLGVTIAAGFHGWYDEGHTAARMIIGHLRGEMDIATTGVASKPAVATAINLDSAARQEVVISEAMLELADFIYEGGAGAGIKLEIPGMTTLLEEMPLEERMAADQAFLAGLRCTEEMIAEQQAALDAEA